MRQLTVGTSQTLISAPGNRDFCAIYNNGAQTCYLCFDGDDGISSEVAATTLASTFSLTNTNSYSALVLNSIAGIFVGQLISGAGIPANVYVTGVISSGGTVGVYCTTFTATANSSGSYTFGQTALTSSNGFPLPAATWMNFDNSSFRNVQNKAIYGICASSTTDLRIQGG